MTPQNPAERMVWRAMTWTWPFYAFGALYVVGPVLGWLLAGLAGLALYLGPAIRPDLRATGSIPGIVWLWMLGMGAMLVALWFGHLNWDLGTKASIKSSIGWAKGWALLPLFILAGAVLPIRRALIVRAHCVVGAWTLALAPLMLAAPYVGLPESLYTSPLKAVGGPGPEYFRVYLFTWDPASWTPRWQFYAPWSPFAALLGVLAVLFALEEKNRRWMLIGVGGGLLMILASKSRMGLVGLIACTLGPRMLSLIARAWAWQLAAGLTASMAVFGTWVLQKAQDGVHAFSSARADSSRVRATLQRIAWERWQGEAVWFGHGRVEPGPHLVEYMPIGSHHTWYGLLFVKGLTGALALAVPLLAHLGVVLHDAARNPRGWLPLGIMMTIVLLSMGENLEIEAYMIWPSLIVLGLHLREMASDRETAPQSDSLAQGTARAI
ncbi:O-antigen ligase domain-containing protein [Thalassobius vesicularis]|uniref:O-antigen ligase domain-containing protein n=1 Tax=Thalassobius vesicularis TaxID=1294297 RepID=A0A4S3M9L7_9RHOB|nr:O-antigen ligase domain-containing protein [Thalassobius vesicularis]THD74760.1 O-antigen ligase domain-containing protein [Thalassobius vesicularis]